MDAIFEQSRPGLVADFDAVRQAQAQMEQLARAATPDEAALDAQIDRVSQALSALEKANTHMLLMLRKELDAEQIRELEPMRMLQQMRKGWTLSIPGVLTRCARDRHCGSSPQLADVYAVSWHRD